MGRDIPVDLRRARAHLLQEQEHGPVCCLSVHIKRVHGIEEWMPEFLMEKLNGREIVAVDHRLPEAPSVTTWVHTGTVEGERGVHMTFYTAIAGAQHKPMGALHHTWALLWQEVMNRCVDNPEPGIAQEMTRGYMVAMSGANGFRLPFDE